MYAIGYSSWDLLPQVCNWLQYLLVCLLKNTCGGAAMVSIHRFNSVSGIHFFRPKDAKVQKMVDLGSAVEDFKIVMKHSRINLTYRLVKWWKWQALDVLV